MTGQHVSTIAIAIVFPLAMLLYSNSRITDTRDTMLAELRELRAELQGQMNTLRAEMRAGFERLETLLKIHELEHHK